MDWLLCSEILLSIIIQRVSKEKRVVCILSIRRVNKGIQIETNG